LAAPDVAPVPSPATDLPMDGAVRAIKAAGARRRRAARPDARVT
jgi:hypothetical protein